MYAAFDKNSQTITLSNPVIVSGTASFQGKAADTPAAPSYTWENDTNTGLYHPTVDAMGLVTAGVERMRIIPTGNVGIGTTTPYGLFQVQGSSTALTVTTGGNVGIGTTTPVAGFSIQAAGYSLFRFPVVIMEERQNNLVVYVNRSIQSAATTTGLPTAVNPSTWRVRCITNTIYPSDTNDVVRTFCTLTHTTGPGDSYFTLSPGTYHIYAEGTAVCVGRHRIALTSTAAAGTVVSTTTPPPGFVNNLIGTSEITYPVAASTIRTYLASDPGSTPAFADLSSSKSVITGIFNVTDNTTRYRIQHFTNKDDSFGIFGCPSGSGTDDVYLRVILTRYA